MSTWHFVNLTFCQLDIVSTWHFVNLTLCQLDILSTWLFVNFVFGQLDILSTWHFVNLTFCQLDFLSTLYLVSMSVDTFNNASFTLSAAFLAMSQFPIIKWHLARTAWIQCYKTFYNRNLRIFVNKLVCLFLASLSSPVICLWVRPGTHPWAEHPKNASLR